MVIFCYDRLTTAWQLEETNFVNLKGFVGDEERETHTQLNVAILSSLRTSARLLVTSVQAQSGLMPSKLKRILGLASLELELQSLLNTFLVWI